MNEFITPKKCIVSFFLSFFSFLLSYSQSSLDYNPNRYNVPITNIQSSSYVNESTGRATFTIELANAKTNALQQAITLSYSSNGFNVNDKNSLYGKGWSLNYGPVITRDINYFADEQDKIKLHDPSTITNPANLGSRDMSAFNNAYAMDIGRSSLKFDLGIGVRSANFYKNYIETHKVDLEVDYFYYDINGFKNMFSVLERINDPIYTALDNTSYYDINRLYLDHKFISISRRKGNSYFIIKSQGAKYYFAGGNKIWKRTRNFNYTLIPNTTINWDDINIAKGYSTYNIESIAPDNGYEVNDKINFTYETLPIDIKAMEGFHYKSYDQEIDFGIKSNWSVYKAQHGGMFFEDFRSSCIAQCMSGVTSTNPGANIIYQNCLSNCNAIAAEQDAGNKVDWNNLISQSPEIIKEERKIIKSIDSKEYLIDFFYTVLNNDVSNKVLNEILVYQKSYKEKILIFKYKFSYANYGLTVNLLKDVSKYSSDNILIDRYKFDYYNENSLITSNFKTVPINKHNNFILSNNLLESSQTAELKEIFLSDGASIKYNYIQEPNEEGVIVSSLDLNSGKNVLNYKFTYLNSVPNFFINEELIPYAIATYDCYNFEYTDRYAGMGSSVRSKEIIKPYRPSYFKSMVTAFPDGSKIKKTFDMYASQIKLIKEELIDSNEGTVKKTEYNYDKHTVTTNPYGPSLEASFQDIGFKVYLTADLSLFYINKTDQYVVGDSCEPGNFYKSFGVQSVPKSSELNYLKSVNTKEYFNGNIFEDNISYEYDLVNNNNFFPVKSERYDSKGKSHTSFYTYDTKLWKPTSYSSYIDNVLEMQLDKEYDNLGQITSEKTKNYRNNIETLLSDYRYRYENGQLIYVKNNVSGYKKLIVNGYGGFRPLYELEYLSDVEEQVFTIPIRLQEEYDNLPVYFSSLIDIYGVHFKSGFLYNPHGVYKLFDISKRSTTFLYDAAGRVIQKLDHEGNILEENRYFSKVLGSIPLSINNDKLFGNYDWKLFHEDCLDTPDNSNYNLGCISSNGNNISKIKLHYKGNIYNFSCSNDQTILDAASSAGITIPVLNGVGVDNANMSRLKYGKIDQSDQSFLGDCKMSNGYILLESSYPLCDCEIFFIGASN